MQEENIFNISLNVKNIFKISQKQWFSGKQSLIDTTTIYLKGVIEIEKSSMLSVVQNTSTVLTQKVSIQLRTL